MKPTVTALAAFVVCSCASGVWAHGDVRCVPVVPKAQWRPHTDLHKKLTDEGWVVRQMKQTPTCYEVYAKDPKGKRVEVFFHPKTFERVE